VSTTDIHQPSDEAPSSARWVLDPARSTVEFRVPHFWSLITVKGTFDRIDGSLAIAPEGSWTIAVGLEAASIDSGNARRDKHLRSADFFDVAQHPRLGFTSTSAVREGDVLRVSGELEAAGRRVPLSFEAGVGERGDELEVEATTTADQRAFGMTWSPLGMARTPATLYMKARLVRA